VFSHWPRVVNTLRMAAVLAAAMERAGDVRGAAAIYGDIIRVGVLGRDSATYALQGDVMAAAIEIPYRHAVQSLQSRGVSLTGLDRIARAESAAGIYFDHSGRPDLASRAYGQLEASYELSQAIRQGSGRRGGRAWAAWNSSWFRPTAMWGGCVLLLAQAIVLAVIWANVSLSGWIRASLGYPMLLIPDRSTVSSALVVALVPSLAAPGALLWTSWHLHIGWPASQTELVAPAGGWFLSFVGVAVLPLITFLGVAVAGAGWRRYRRRHLNVGFAAETLAILRATLPLALCLTLLVYALSLIPLLHVRAEAERLVDHVLAFGEMSFLR